MFVDDVILHLDDGLGLPDDDPEVVVCGPGLAVILLPQLRLMGKNKFLDAIGSL